MNTELPKELQGCRIREYFHCKNCFLDHDKEKQKQSGNLAVGWTPEGIQVYCENCDQNVYDIDFQGNKIKIL